MNVFAGSVDVTTYFALRLTASGLEATALDVTTFDLQYVRTGTAPVAKVDATALAATDTAHTDNKAIEIDATDQPGLYRVDWPDAAFAAGVREVILSVKAATVFTEHLRVSIDIPIMPQKNVAFSNIEFLMVDATDHVTPETGLTVSGTRSIDGGAFGAVTGTIAEVGDGIYQFDATAADMNGTIITFRFTATGAADRFLTIKTGG